ncbi:substrate-binding domain-containing protein [Rhizobium laguerreae]|uniref:hypothetical protein n=1 Tax=Rhizobium laguerreae TaxID=1076926 RepID=UPI0021B1483D|nr:hypothetical protein [Rhizobium laguerreae]
MGIKLVPDSSEEAAYQEILAEKHARHPRSLRSFGRIGVFVKALGLATLSVKLGRRKALGAAFGIAAALMAGQAAAEGKIRIAQQFGISYLILDVVRDQKLIEKHGKEAGVDIAVEWASISGATAMNEALLANNLDIVSAGVPPALTMWDRTKGNVKLVAALCQTISSPSIRMSIR